MVEVKFQYDESLEKWSAHVTNVDNSQIAREAFCAVVMTCQMINPYLQQQAVVEKAADGSYRITPAI